MQSALGFVVIANYTPELAAMRTQVAHPSATASHGPKTGVESPKPTSGQSSWSGVKEF